jgi:hypothetical protein
MNNIDAVLTALKVRDGLRERERPGILAGFAAVVASLVAVVLVLAVTVGPLALVCYTAYKIVQLVVS